MTPRKNYKKNSKLKYLRIKSILDKLLTLLIIILCLPLLISISLLIKFGTRGPIFYSQKRIGKNLKPFYCLKFRTMHPEADDILNNLLSRNNELRKEFDLNHKLKNDPRITNIGKFLRKTSLDELPQFINVLRNEMSIVGPRPIVNSEKKKYGKKLDQVFSVSPGITGLWQVSGRNNLSYKKRVELDYIYSNNLNILMDIRILIRTFGVILFPLDRGAY